MFHRKRVDEKRGTIRIESRGWAIHCVLVGSSDGGRKLKRLRKMEWLLCCVEYHGQD